jgi:hypothetical protein
MIPTELKPRESRLQASWATQSASLPLNARLTRNRAAAKAGCTQRGIPQRAPAVNVLCSLRRLIVQMVCNEDLKSRGGKDIRVSVGSRNLRSGDCR